MEKSETGRNNCYRQFKKFKFYNMEKRELASIDCFRSKVIVTSIILL